MRPRRFMKNPAKLEIKLGLCDSCKPKLTVADILDDEGWREIERKFRGLRKKVPKRKLTKICWESLAGTPPA